MSGHRTIVFAFDGVQSLDVTGPAEVLAGANSVLNHDAYDVHIVSQQGGAVATESAVKLHTEPISDLVGADRFDTVVVPGGFSVFEHAYDQQMVGALRNLITRSDRLVTVCTGAYLAAATGALDGHRVTTHWARARRMADEHPAVTVDPDPIYLRSSGRLPAALDVWSSAGVTAGIDMTLALVEQDHGTEAAQTIARWLVMFLRRPGGQSQFAVPTWTTKAPPGPIRQAQDLIIETPGDDHRVASLAAKVAMSERHFVRRFTAEVGVSPARFVTRVRVDAARQELERTDDPVAVIARRCGFGTAETLRRTLQRHLGVSPDRYRQRFAHHQPKGSNPS